MDLGIESPDVMRPGLIEGGFLAKSQSTMLDTAEVLSIKFDAKKDAEITQVDAVARARRSVPLMNFLVVLLAEDVFVDVSPAIIVSNAGACLLFDGFNHWCPSMVSGLLPHAIYRLGQAAVVSANSCLACFAGVHSLISCQHRTCCAESQ